LRSSTRPLKEDEHDVQRADQRLLARYLRLLDARFDGSLLIPIPALTEVRTGHRSSDIAVDRLIMSSATLASLGERAANEGRDVGEVVADALRMAAAYNVPRAAAGRA